MREALDKLAALLHDREVGGEVRVEHVVKAQRAQRGGHLSDRRLLVREAQLLRPRRAHGGRHLHDGGDLRILQRRRDLGGVVAHRERPRGAMGDALSAKRAVRVGERAVEAHAHGGARAAPLHVPDLQRLDLVAHLDAAHALDALALLAHEIAVLGPLVLLHALGIGIVQNVELRSKLLQLAVLRAHAGGAVAVVLGEDQLQVRLPRGLGAVGVRLHDHSLRDLLRAGGDEALKSLHLDHTDAAGGDLVESLQIAEGGDADADGGRRL